jgi:tight adherence protein B
MPGMLWIAIAAFVGVAALVGSVAMLMRDRGESAVEDRLQMLTGGGTAKQNLESEKSVLAQPLDEKPGLFDEMFNRFGNIHRIFEQADTSLTLTKFVLISALLGGLGMVAGLPTGLPLPLLPVMGIILAGLPTLWLLWRRKSRLKKFQGQLADALDMIGRGLRAGQSLGFGMNMVAQEMPDPISREFGRVFEEQNLGIPMEESLRDLAERVPNLDLTFFVTAVILQRQTGGDLAEILDKISSLIRDRFRIWGQIQALTGEGRISGVVLLGLPFVLFAVMYYLNPDYVMVLFTDPLGQKMLAGGLVMQVFGALLIRKIVTIKV